MSDDAATIQDAPRPAPYTLGTGGGSRPLSAVAVVDGQNIFAISAGRPYRLQADGSLGPELRPERALGPAVAIGAGDGLVAVVSAYPVALAIFRGDGGELAGLASAGLPGISHPAGVAIGGERLAVSWEIAGLPLDDQKMLLGRYRMADPETRRWVRETITAHARDHIPELGL